MDDFDFTIALYHGGKIKSNPFKYEGGEVKRYEDNNSEEMSLVEIMNMVKEFGYGWNDVLLYRVPTIPFADGLKPLKNDNDVMDMVKYVKGYNEVDVYVMSLADYEADGGNEENGDNEGDEVEGDDHEEDSACKVHFGGSESDNNDMFDIDEVASKQVKPSAKVNLKAGVEPSKLDAFEDVGGEDKWDSEASIGLVDSSSDDEATPRYPQYRPPESFSEVKFEIEMQFATKNDVMDAIKHYSIFKSVPLKFKKNDRVRVRVKCKDGCPFELYCGKMKNEDTWQVKTLRDEHNCGNRLKNRFASSNWLGKHLVDQVRSDPKMKTALIKTEVASMFKVHISRHQASRAKSNAKELVQGTFKEQYAQLRDYCEELMRSNPYSTAILSTNRPQPHLQPLFERFYVCLDACKKGFLDGCRPFIGVDGCHLKGQYPGQLLTAVGKDGNNGVYPIAFAVVEAETKDSWTWFMTNLLKDVGKKNWTFMSDQQKVNYRYLLFYFPWTMYLSINYILTHQIILWSCLCLRDWSKHLKRSCQKWTIDIVFDTYIITLVRNTKVSY
jgi:hypothetical protein